MAANVPVASKRVAAHSTRTDSPLPIFSDRTLVPAGAPHTVMLYPFWGKPPEDSADPNTGRFDRYASVGGRFFRLAAPDEAELAVFPTDWTHFIDRPAELPASAEFAAEAREAGIPTVAFFVNDSDEPVGLPGATVFRTTLYRSRRRASEFAQPAWSEDFVGRYAHGELPVRSKQNEPTVGFCGLAPRARLDRFRRTSSEGTIRARGLNRLRRTKGMRTNFLVRKEFVGGAVQNGRTDARKMERVRGEYVRNMIDSDYVLCARGAGNFSYRLYETLSCGRIPVFVDTDCVLPYDFMIEWRDYVVWVEEARLDEIGELVLEFHERLSDNEFVELQRECRRVWERFLRPEGFFENLPRHFAEPAAVGEPVPSEVAPARADLS
jgi:Exostosin family